MFLHGMSMRWVAAELFRTPWWKHSCAGYTGATGSAVDHRKPGNIGTHAAHFAAGDRGTGNVSG